MPAASSFTWRLALGAHRLPLFFYHCRCVVGIRGAGQCARLRGRGSWSVLGPGGNQLRPSCDEYCLHHHLCHAHVRGTYLGELMVDASHMLYMVRRRCCIRYDLQWWKRKSVDKNIVYICGLAHALVVDRSRRSHLFPASLRCSDTLEAPVWPTKCSAALKYRFVHCPLHPANSITLVVSPWQSTATFCTLPLHHAEC